ncbi:MAG: sulfatase-like hydrolase/transferase [Acidobacteriota bacterium]
MLQLLVYVLQLWIWLVLPSGEAGNLILISVDTLRADRLSCYGYQANRTRHFDRWASEGFLFQQAFSEYPLTLPAHVSMLTGETPLRHRIRENAGFHLDPGQTTLAEILQDQQYRTAAFIGSYVLAAEFGVAQGFEVFDEDFATSIENVGVSTDLQRPAPEVAARFLQWLKENQDQKFFAFVHFYDPHMPRPQGYDSEVSIVDQTLGEIDAFLRESRLLEKTDIVLTSDHGESLGEHGEEGHGFFVYDSTLHVPLIVRPAGRGGRRGERIAHQVSLADLMPTILERLRVPIPASVQGRSLWPLCSGKTVQDTPLYSESFVPQFHFGWSPLASLRLGKYKYIDAPRPELYDLTEDPRETRNLYDQQPTIAREYRKELLAFISKYGAGAPEKKPAPTDTDTARKLLALGYLNTGSAKPKTEGSSLLDPKDRIAVFERYHAVLNELSNSRPGPGVLADLRKLKEAAPEVRGIFYLQAWASELAGNLEAAREMYQEAVKAQPDNTMARSRYATLLIRLRDFDEAEKQLKEIVRQAPSDYKARNNLAGLYRLTGRRDEALREIREITRIRPQYAIAWLNLGRLEAEAGNAGAAEAALAQAYLLDPKLRQGR